MSIGNTVENDILDHLFKATAFNYDTFVSLHDGDPGETGANEITGGSYARQEVLDAAWNAATGGLTDNVNDIDFTLMPALTVTHIGLWSAVTAGVFLWGGALSASKVVNLNDTFRFAAGDANFTLD